MELGVYIIFKIILLHVLYLITDHDNFIKISTIYNNNRLWPEASQSWYSDKENDLNDQ